MTTPSSTLELSESLVALVNLEGMTIALLRRLFKAIPSDLWRADEGMQPLILGCFPSMSSCFVDEDQERADLFVTLWDRTFREKAPGDELLQRLMSNLIAIKDPDSILFTTAWQRFRPLLSLDQRAHYLSLLSFSSSALSDLLKDGVDSSKEAVHNPFCAVSSAQDVDALVQAGFDPFQVMPLCRHHEILTKTSSLSGFAYHIERLVRLDALTEEAKKRENVLRAMLTCPVKDSQLKSVVSHIFAHLSKLPWSVTRDFFQNNPNVWHLRGHSGNHLLHGLLLHHTDDSSCVILHWLKQSDELLHVQDSHNVSLWHVPNVYGVHPRLAGWLVESTSSPYDRGGPPVSSMVAWRQRLSRLPNGRRLLAMAITDSPAIDPLDALIHVALDIPDNLDTPRYRRGSSLIYALMQPSFWTDLADHGSAYTCASARQKTLNDPAWQARWDQFFEGAIRMTSSFSSHQTLVSHFLQWLDPARDPSKPCPWMDTWRLMLLSSAKHPSPSQIEDGRALLTQGASLDVFERRWNLVHSSNLPDGFLAWRTMITDWQKQTLQTHVVAPSSSNESVRPRL